MWKLRNFDPLEADPSHIRIAVVTDEIVQLKDDAVTLELSFESEFPEHNFKNKSKATVKANSVVDELSHLLNSEQRITLFYLDTDAAHQMRLSQNRIRIIKENDVKGRGSFGLSIHTGCFKGPKPNSLIANVYAQFSPDRGYIKMISNIDLLKQLEPHQEEFWHECSADRESNSTPHAIE